MRALRIRFYIDPSTGARIFLIIKVGEDEVADVLEGPGEDRSGGEGSGIALGQTASGRYLRVIYGQTQSLTAFW
jgi:hypothetical protein